MYYNSGTGWNIIDDHPESVYITRMAVSEDGINWKRSAGQAFPSKVNSECQTSPTIIYLNNKHHMYFSYRHGTNFRNKQRGYRIGYAWSEDMLNWVRDDQKAGIDISSSGWDS